MALLLACLRIRTFKHPLLELKLQGGGKGGRGRGGRSSKPSLISLLINSYCSGKGRLNQRAPGKIVPIFLKSGYIYSRSVEGPD